MLKRTKFAIGSTIVCALSAAVVIVIGLLVL